MIYEKFNADTGPKLAVLIDPDRNDEKSLLKLIRQSENCRVDFFFAGGTLMVENNFERVIDTLKGHSKIPLLIFPGSNDQLSKKADAILLLSLISGRNPEYLIGQHVVAAHKIKELEIEVIPTAYLLIDGGRISSTSYITQTLPIPNDKPEIAAATALAGELLGMKLIYLEAGSGAKNTLSADMIIEVKRNVSIPVIVGGGICSAQQAEKLCGAGADVLVVGNILEKEPEVLMDISLAVHGANKLKQ